MGDDLRSGTIINRPERVVEKEIIVGGSASKPYYEIKYRMPGEEDYHVGYGSYCLEYVFEWFDSCFEMVEEEPKNKQCHKLI